MTAQIIQFPPRPVPVLKRIAARAKRPVEVVEGVIVAEVPPNAVPAGYDLALPTANRFAHIDWKPPAKPRRRRAQMRVEQLPVTCTRVPRKQHADLRTLTGVLTIDWKGEVPWTATFDPDEESIPNIVAPVEKFTRTADSIEIACDEGTWVFAPLTDDSDDDED